MIKNYTNNDKKIAMKLKRILINHYMPVENVDDGNQTATQTDNQSDFLALRIIDNLIRFNQSFRLSQVAIKAKMGKYKKTGGVVETEIEDLAQPKSPSKVRNLIDGINQKETEYKSANNTPIKNKTPKKTNKDDKKADEETIPEAEELDSLLNQFDSDNKFPSSFETLLNAYSLLQNIDRNYKDLRPIFNNLSVPVFNDLNDIIDETNELIKKSVKSFNLGKSPHMKKNISYNIDDYIDKFNKIVSTFNNIYNDFKQRKQTFNTNIKTGSGFGYLSKIRNI